MGSEVQGGWAGWGAGCLPAPLQHPPLGRPELGDHPGLGRRVQTDAWALSADNAPILGRSTTEKMRGKTQLKINSSWFTHLGNCAENAYPHSQIPLDNFNSHQII